MGLKGKSEDQPRAKQIAPAEGVTPLECAPGAGQVELGFQRMKPMARQRSHSIEFKRQVAQEFIAGESLYALSKRHDTLVTAEKYQ